MTDGGSDLVLVTSDPVTSLDRCAVCDSRCMFPVASRREYLRTVAVEAFDAILEDVPRRPNNLCPEHWQPFLDMRNKGRFIKL